MSVPEGPLAQRVEDFGQGQLHRFGVSYLQSVLNHSNFLKTCFAPSDMSFPVLGTIEFIDNEG